MVRNGLVAERLARQVARGPGRLGARQVASSNLSICWCFKFFKLAFDPYIFSNTHFSINLTLTCTSDCTLSMPNIDDLDNSPTFNKHEWLGQNKIYSPKNLPYFVVDACTKAFAVPQRERWRFPSRDITIVLKSYLKSLSSHLSDF